MNAASHTLTDLSRNATLRVDDGHAHVVAVFEGQVWVTQSGRSDDFILSAGESVRLDRRGLGVVQALADSRITVLEPTGERDDWPGALGRLLSAARRAGSPWSSPGAFS